MNKDLAVPIEVVLEIYRRMVRIRQFEDRLYQMFLQGLVPGTLHQYQGQEAIAAGVCVALRPEDVVFSTHRPVGHAIAKGVPLGGIAAEQWGKATGCAGGKGGQMHLVDSAVGFPPSSAVVGSNIPMAVGAALGFKLRGLDCVAVSFFGDGASNTGAFHEGLNLAAVKDAPVIFICENNQYAASTHISLAMRISDIALTCSSLWFPGSGCGWHGRHRRLQLCLSSYRPRPLWRRPHPARIQDLPLYGALARRPGRVSQQTGSRAMAESRSDPATEECLDHPIQPTMLDLSIRSTRTSWLKLNAAIQFAQTSPDPDPETTYQHVFAD